MLPLPRLPRLAFSLPLVAALLPATASSQTDSIPTQLAFGDSVYVEELPEAVRKVLPDYSQIDPGTPAGTVLVPALVDKYGRVRDTKIVKSVPGLDSLAAAAVYRWEFKPARSLPTIHTPAASGW